MEYDAIRKRIKLLSHTKTWLNFTDMKFNERCQMTRTYILRDHTYMKLRNNQNVIGTEATVVLSPGGKWETAGCWKCSIA